jgi:hypothetical protein
MLARIGLALGACGIAVVASVLAGWAETGLLVALIPIAVGGVIVTILYRVNASQELAAAQVRELPSRGVRRTGRVRDAVPYGSPHGGAVFQAEGAQMVLRVELDGGGTVTVHVVEDSERARGRIGTEVTILEHPDEPSLRALDGFLPNGRPA